MMMGVAGERFWWTRAVLDTSVLMSEHRHWLWLLARQNLYEGVWSAFIVGELVRVRTELSIKKGADDEPILATALASDANELMLVTRILAACDRRASRRHGVPIWITWPSGWVYASYQRIIASVSSRFA